MTPAVSVVVATYNRAGLLPRLVDCLQAQRDAPPFEVVAVDDGSTDTTWAVLERLASERRVDLRPIRHGENSGPASARNVGWRSAAGPLVVFTDDDCQPQPGWLAAMVRAAASADIVQGVTLMDPEQEQERLGPFSRFMQMRTEEGQYPTCNIAYRREVLQRVGGFDERYRPVVAGRGRKAPTFGEDTDLAWRAREAGATFAFERDAVVLHDVGPSDYVGYLRELRRRDGLVFALRLHPGLRGALDTGLFLRPTHGPALVALSAAVALAAAPRRRTRWALATAAAGWYAAVCRWHYPKPKRPADWAWVVPLAWAADVVDVAILARSSVRHRTILL